MGTLSKLKIETILALVQFYCYPRTCAAIHHFRALYTTSTSTTKIESYFIGKVKYIWVMDIFEVLKYVIHNLYTYSNISNIGDL